jgi:nucleotide-binding universal stress UspA family protein
MTEAPAAPRIVVGVDGSPEAATALEFAIEEARLREGSLHVTYAYAVTAAGVGSTSEELFAHLETDAKTVLEHIAAASDSTEGLDVEWVAVPGNPSEVLVEASQGATLLVVGSRGHGGFLGLLMGSVSTQCVQHSHCPVLVVRKEH